MANWGLWYYKWNESKYEILSDWNDQKFDYIIVTDGGLNGTEGTSAKYSGPGYNDGYGDAGELIGIIENQWLRNRDYIVEIPYFYVPPEGGKKARPLDYLLGWIDGAAAEGSSHFKGFYWSLENIRYIQEGKLSRYTLDAVSGRIQENKRVRDELSVHLDTKLENPTFKQGFLIRTGRFRSCGLRNRPSKYSKLLQQCFYSAGILFHEKREYCHTRRGTLYVFPFGKDPKNNT